mgnify:CR=1 FL=1
MRHQALLFASPEFLLDMSKSFEDHGKRRYFSFVAKNGLPPDVKLMGVAYDPHRDRIVMRVEHPSFPETGDNELLPILPDPRFQTDFQFVPLPKAKTIVSVNDRTKTLTVSPS